MKESGFEGTVDRNNMYSVIAEVMNFWGER